MDAIYALLFFATVIAIIYLAGRWNTSDVDHYMGFDNLRQPRKQKASTGEGDAEKE
ncbi:hypothetical protein FHT77_003124 [Rhizobium sp. BK181]|uniref:hypothetical protein n=1 Tax=Rhizobium sp. BK181 TaxID=2587072 RepID=UPI0016229A0F|nr:hypothetical protein [Rhizobium sp. BK181]MBB3317242.1 hypothetical protein [Rhizobium sp. BK181]